MSMLAERKRKTKWVINPTKKPLWTAESCDVKFGKELMEKMGWAPGKGLGLKEQGMQEPLKVSYKNDVKGFGFKGNDEEWIEQQDEFNLLLSQLASNNNESVIKQAEIEKNEVRSLEEKSKQSRARVHYQKFTRGKDLSRYSENDLACILGTSKVKKDKVSTVDKVKTEAETKEGLETSFGVTTINSGSIQDYFKKKFTSVNKTSNLSTMFNGVIQNDADNSSDRPCFMPDNADVGSEKGKSRKRKHNLDLEMEKSTIEETEAAQKIGFNSENDIRSKKHKKKKTKEVLKEPSGESEVLKLKESGSDGINNAENETFKLSEGILIDKTIGCDNDLGAENIVKKKKKSKKKHMEHLEVSVIECEETQNSRKEKKKKKKDKKKERDILLEEKSISEDITMDIEVNDFCSKEMLLESVDHKEEDSHVKTLKHKKKKKKKLGQAKEENNEQEKQNKIEPENVDFGESNVDSVVKKKSKKHRKEKAEKLGSEIKVDKVTVTKIPQGNCDKSESENTSEKDISVNGSEDNLKLTAIGKENKLKLCSETKPESDGVIHSHKVELFRNKGLHKNFTNERVLKLVCGAEIERFKGSNLKHVVGYGIKEETR